MNRALQNSIIGVYALLNRSGLLETAPGKFVFRTAYFAYKYYLEDAFAALLRMAPQICSGGLVLDVGANISYTSVLFSRHIGKEYSVISFEPDHRNFKTLREVVAARANITPVWAAVGDRDGEINFWTNPTHHADSRTATESFRTKRADHQNIYSVPMVSIDSYLASNHRNAAVALIKIDVQGYEQKVLEGCRKTLAEHKDIAVVFEYSPDSIQELGLDPQIVLTFFEEQDFKLFFLNRKSGLRPFLLGDIEAELSANGYCEIVAARSDLCCPA